LIENRREDTMRRLEKLLSGYSFSFITLALLMAACPEAGVRRTLWR
jgi:hypothetical protein